MSAKLTPMMQHFYQVKREYPDTLIFYRMGEFYEMFDQDAVISAKILEIALTSRDKKNANALPMCGIPVNSHENYINKLTKAGHKVAICEQLEDPKLAKGLVKRGVTRVITPGTILSSSLLDAKKNHFIASIAIDSKQKQIGLAFCDLTTGEFEYDQLELGGAKSNLEEMLFSYHPAEIIFAKEGDEPPTWLVSLIQGLHKKPHLEALDPYHFQQEPSRKQLLDQFQTANLEPFGLENKRHAAEAAGAMLSYLQATQKDALRHILGLKAIQKKGVMMLDEATIRNLELLESAQTSLAGTSLIELLDSTKTAMGARLLKRWLKAPLLEQEPLEQRYNAIQYLMDEFYLTDSLQKSLKSIGDLERIITRLSLPVANLSDLIRLKNSLEPLEELAAEYTPIQNSPLGDLLGSFDPLTDLYALLDSHLMEQPHLKINEGGYIQVGIHEKLDEFRSLARDAKMHMSLMEAEEKEKTKINSLKIGFNKVFGYYYEISNANKHLAPEYFIRKQTLTNGERYITPDLKELEEKILSAKEESVLIEEKIYQEILNKVQAQIRRVQAAASWLAKLDVLCNLAELARTRGFTRPHLRSGNGQYLKITKGRHPVIEAFYQEEPFTPNDLTLQQDKHFISIITGPNMGGKSTFMRQAAIMVLMAQIGSFVPADSLEMSLFDRVFTRVGASDNLAKGQSTFMVEMNEAAAILNNTTDKSLVILDEIGRGTSTFDGISIAWSMLEFLHKKKCCTLFATHYHELILLEDQLEGVRNDKVLVAEENDKILFLRKVVAGKADKSYGIQVANLAGLPFEVVMRAKNVLAHLEAAESSLGQTKKQALAKVENMQLSFGAEESPWVQEIKEFDLNNATPMQAMEFIYQLKEKVQ